MWSHLESKLSGILCSAFVAMFEENPGVKEKFYSGISTGAGSDVGMVKNGEHYKLTILNYCLMDFDLFLRTTVLLLQRAVKQTQAVPGRTVKEQREHISPNHAERIFLSSVVR